MPMFSDTHFHFHYLYEKHGADFCRDILMQMVRDRVFFGLDIGTDCSDLPQRASCIEKSLEAIEDADARNLILKFIHFSAGIWPDPESIRNRFECMKVLEKCVGDFRNHSLFGASLCAIGEGGIDHHWNPSGADGRASSDFDTAMFEAEKELFELQLDFARRLNLPFIVHSRDGFSDTLDSIRNVGYNKGIIHCYSYGIDEARTFLDLGWHISLSGSVTYTKKSRMEEMSELIKFIPSDRILLETDSPYLSPVPLRGTENNPTNVRHTYSFVADLRGISVEDLSALVDENSRKLFMLK